MLYLNGVKIAGTTTDFFGEFKIDRIPKNSGTFDLLIRNQGETVKTLQVTVGEGCPNAGVIYID